MPIGIYLAENQIGFDASLVGFPGLGDCMGLALLTQHGLFGFHIYGVNSTKTPSFATFCQTHAGYGLTSHLYGSCNFERRYGSTKGRLASWLAEMGPIATALGYHGPMSGFDISHPGNGFSTGSSAYIEYERIMPVASVVIRYAHTHQVTAVEAKPAATAVKFIRPDNSLSAPYLNKVTVSVTSAGAGMNNTTDDGMYSVTV